MTDPRTTSAPAGADTTDTPAASLTEGLALGVHQQALRTPRAVAVADGDVRLEYAELNAAGAALCEALRRSGVRPGQAVALAMPRSWQLVCAMLGVLRLGAQVVPLDTRSPAQRRRHILLDSEAVAVVHASAIPDELPNGVRPLAMDELLPRVPGAQPVPEAPAPCTGVSFMFYTSGTTGRPKGVQVRDSGVVRLAQPGYMRMEAGDRYACLCNPAFDPLNFEIWVPLLTGGCCVVFRDEDVQTPELLADALRRERIDTLTMAVALFNATVDAVPDCFSTVGQVLLGGEQLNARIVSRWYRDNASAPTLLYNVYGPTEATTFVLSHPVPRDFDGDVVPIGRPLPGSGAVLVADGQERTAAPGEIAELFVTGPQLAAGYKNLPDETAGRFVRLPWLDGGESVHYRTGDLVRADADGLVEYIGRADRQVKVRGFRIEPGEVERQIEAHPAVRKAHVCTRRSGQDGPNELLAFVVLGQDLTYEEFDEHLAGRLTSYMRPHQVHLVPALPLNANRKVDEAALLAGADRPWRPVAADTADTADAAPLTEQQREVLRLAEEILQVTGLTLGDRWIACGGDSLKALRLRFEIRRRFGCDVAQSAVLHADLAGIAGAVASLRDGGESPYPVPAPPTGARTAPATSEQQRLWLLQRRTPDSLAYGACTAFTVEGPVDEAALRHALRTLVERHAALRTSFDASGAQGLRQVVADPYDPWHTPGEERVWDGTAARAFADRFFSEPFDLAQPRMLRACWLPGEGGGTLLLHLHHIAVDGWSLGILLRDLSAAYARAVSAAEVGQPEPPAGQPEPAAAATPLDYAVWQADWFTTDAYRRQREQLLAVYGGVSEPSEPLPSSGSDPAPRARLLHTALDAAQQAEVDRRCAELGLTRFQVLLAAFSWSLYGVTGLTRPRVAAPVANRPVREFEDSVGMLANTVLLPVAIAPHEELHAQLPRVADGIRQVLECQEVALADTLVDCQPADDGSLFDVLFVLENTDFGALALPGCVQRPLWWAPPEAKCPLTVSVVERGDGLDVLWEYADGRFDDDTVRAMAGLFRQGLEALAAGAATTAGQLVAPYRRSLPEHGRGETLRPAFRTVADGFAHQVARTPDAPAVVADDGRSVTYAQLDAHAAALAAELSARYTLPEDGGPCQVALHLDPSTEHVVALLALARLNLTAVPLDPSYPPAVLRHILEQVDPLCVMVMPHAGAALDAVVPDGTPRHPVVLRDAAAPDVRPDTAPAERTAHDGARPLYTLFTSGSTGVPKGVQVFDRTLCNLLTWQEGSGGLGAAAVTQQFSMLSFDVSFQEIFSTLCGGGRLHLVRPGWRHDPAALLEQLESAGAERLFLPYVALQLLAEYGVRLGRFPSRLREVLTAGEQLVCTPAIRRFFAALPGARLFNHYGPTETHVVSALCLDGDPAHWPERPAIGRPVAGAVLRVVDAAGEPVPPGCTGDLLIGGTMTTRCYLGDPALNDARFVEVPGDGLFYRSGDRAWFDREGMLHYAGRNDQQVKLSGHRLELGSVEAALLRHPAVTNAVVVLDEGRLVACLESREQTPPADDLAAHLAAELPAYVRVDRFRQLDVLPRTPSGKLDRKAALRAPGRELRRSADARASFSPEEQRLADAFEAVAGLAIGPDQAFFDAGASSLTLMRFHLRCTTELGLRFSVADLFEHVTIRKLARHLSGSGPESGKRPEAAAEHEAVRADGDRARYKDEPIAVIGMAVRLPGAPDLASFWDLVVSGGTGIRYFDAPDGMIGARSQLDGMFAFDPGHFRISPQEARLMDPQQRHLLMACEQALAHAGIADPSAARIGLIASAGESTYFQSMLREADPRSLPDSFQLALHHEKDFLATKAAYHLNLTGPAFTAQAACASSLIAVHVAAGLLRQGDAEVMLAGGVLVDSTVSDGYRYRPQHIFSADGHCRPFSDDASGTVGASGVGVVVLKPLSLARRDGDTVYGLVTGSALNNDGSDKLGYSAPSLAGQREVIRSALDRAGRTGADLGYVEAHGTGTRLGDPVEVGALRQAFDVTESGVCALASVKSQMGHLGAAAGVVGLVRAVLAVHHATIPPNIGFGAFNPEIGPDPTPFRVPAEAGPWPAGRRRIAAVSSFGIGGTNAHMIVEQDDADLSARSAGDGGVPPVLVLSADSEQVLRTDAARIADHLQDRPENLGRVLRHLQAGRVARRLRAATPCPDSGFAVRWLRALASGEVTPAAAGFDESPTPAAGRTAEQLAVAFTTGPVDWPAGAAPAPWDFPPPSFALSDYAFRRAVTPAAGEPQRLPEDAWLHQPNWVRLHRAGAGTPSDTTAPGAPLLVVMTARPLPQDALTAFRSVAGRVVQVSPADSFAHLGPDTFEADPADPASLRQLLDTLRLDTLEQDATDGTGDGRVEWIHALPLAVEGLPGAETLGHARRAALDTTAALVKALSGRALAARVWWLSYGAQPVREAVRRPELNQLAGVIEVVHQEQAIDGHWLDLPDGNLTRWAAQVAAVVRSAVRPQEDPGVPLPLPLPRRLALREGYWWRQETAAVTSPEARHLPLSGGEGTHLVLGGTGGIGRAVAAWLLEQTAGRVLLLSRNPQLPAELEQWAERVDLVAADLATMPVHEVTAVIARHTSRLDSVVHAAGTAVGGLVTRRDASTMRVDSAARENGALVTEELIDRYQPAFAVYCSSMSALLGGVGQFDYAAGAALLDGFAGYRGSDVETTVRIAVDWDVWRETGMATRVLNADSRHQAHLAVGLTVEEGKRVFGRVLALQLPHLLVSTTDIEASRAFYVPASRGEADQAPRPDHYAEPAGATEPGDRAGLIGRWLRELVGVEALEPDDSLYDLGADSLTLLHLISMVDEHFGVELDLASFTHQVSLVEILKQLHEVEVPAAPTPSAGRPSGRTTAAPSAALTEPEVALDVWQEGTASTVLCLVHPVGGDIQAYRTLVASLGPEPTVCLIADPALRRAEALPWSLAKRARRYHEALRARYDDSEWDVCLAGWSFGARTAMEMACLAEDEGRPVEALYLLDPPPPQARELIAAYDETQFEAVFAAELGGSGVRPAAQAQAYAERLARCCRANLRSLSDHLVRPLSDTPTHLWLAGHASEGMPSLGDPRQLLEEWGAYLPPTAERAILPTDHYGVVAAPHVHTVSETVTATLPDQAARKLPPDESP
ncbi:amino acid adenylation domain-containing protein [Streptomyces sp. NPDC007856]|uniref:amino acid adenylation domain-containing protein n=1 Tax=Streptomyces sp. NPDC007856 TaxID=3364781 RepID=UPI003679D94A